MSVAKKDLENKRLETLKSITKPTQAQVSHYGSSGVTKPYSNTNYLDKPFNSPSFSRASLDNVPSNKPAVAVTQNRPIDLSRMHAQFNCWMIILSATGEVVGVYTNEDTAWEYCEELYMAHDVESHVEPLLGNQNVLMYVDQLKGL